MTRQARVRLAAILWLVFAFVAWNAVFDRVLVVEGRRYAHDAGVAAKEGRPFIRIDDRMRPAISYGARLASGVGLAIAVFGVSAVIFAARRQTARRFSGSESPRRN